MTGIPTGTEDGLFTGRTTGGGVGDLTGIPTGTVDGWFTGETTGDGDGDGDGDGPGFTQFGGCIGTQVGYGELPLWTHTSPGSQQSDDELHCAE